MLPILAEPMKLTTFITLIFTLVQLTPVTPLITGEIEEDRPVFVLHNGRLHRAHSHSYAHTRESFLRFLKNDTGRHTVSFPSISFS